MTIDKIVFMAYGGNPLWIWSAGRFYFFEFVEMSCCLLNKRFWPTNDPRTFVAEAIAYSFIAYEQTSL